MADPIHAGHGGGDIQGLAQQLADASGGQLTTDQILAAEQSAAVQAAIQAAAADGAVTADETQNVVETLFNTLGVAPESVTDAMMMAATELCNACIQGALNGTLGELGMTTNSTPAEFFGIGGLTSTSTASDDEVAQNNLLVQRRSSENSLAGLLATLND